MCACLFSTLSQEIDSSLFIATLLLHYSIHACSGGLAWSFCPSMQMVATSSSPWTDKQPASVSYQPVSPSWHSLEGIIKYQTKANFAVGHPLATQQVRRRKNKKTGLTKVHRKKEGERDTHCRSNILSASCCHWQADWELICTHYWEMSKARGWWPHYSDRMWCDWRCCAMLISSAVSPRYRK